MEKLPVFLIKVLQILASRYTMSCTLEELTILLNPVSNTATTFADTTSTEKENQAKVLDALIELNALGHIFLNSNNDKSFITIKGLIKVNNKVLCN